jgi:hypothetical protein
MSMLVLQCQRKSKFHRPRRVGFVRQFPRSAQKFKDICWNWHMVGLEIFKSLESFRKIDRGSWGLSRKSLRGFPS